MLIPSFFKIELEDGNIFYLLGSHHDIPLAKLLSHHVIEEIKNINNKGADLYLEHEISNADFIGALKSKHSDEKHNVLDEVKGNKNVKAGDFQSQYMDIKNGIIKINSGEDSQIQIEMLFTTCPLWLAAPILATHQGIIAYDKYGGFEHDLLKKSMESGWHKWNEVKYLEESNDLLQYLETSANKDYNQNCIWLAETVQKLALSPYKKAYEKLIDNYSKTKEYSWTLINHKDVDVHSVVVRNKKWAEKIGNLLSSKRHVPLLIVMGFGHLKGTNNGMVHLLKGKIKIQSIHALNKSGKWVSIII